MEHTEYPNDLSAYSRTVLQSELSAFNMSNDNLSELELEYRRRLKTEIGNRIESECQLKMEE